MTNKQTGSTPPSSQYKTLYHYTTMEGARGIIESQSLWNTHYKFLNDASEGTHAYSILSDIMYPYVKKEVDKLIDNGAIDADTLIAEHGSLKDIILEETETLVSIPLKLAGKDIYVTSLCGETEDNYVNENGLLSQWRGYGADGGVAIVFDTAKLEELFKLETDEFGYNALILGDVVYSDKPHKMIEELGEDLMGNLIKYYTQAFTLLISGQKPDIDDDITRDAYGALVEFMGRLKHHSFKEEDEVRLLSQPLVHTQKIRKLAEEKGSELQTEKEVHWRKPSGIDIPYIVLFSNPDITLPIKKVIVGPHKDKHSRAESLRVLLQKKDIEVIASDIPYIG